MLTNFTDDQRHDVESLCSHIEGNILALRTHLGNLRSGNHRARSVEKVHEQANEIEGWATAIKDVCTGKDKDG